MCVVARAIKILVIGRKHLKQVLTAPCQSRPEILRYFIADTLLL